MFMPAACMPFYLKAYMTYLMSEDSIEDCDGASCFFGIANVRAKEVIADESLTASVMTCLEHLASQQEFYDADVSIYGCFTERAQQAISELRHQQSGRYLAAAVDQ